MGALPGPLALRHALPGRSRRGRLAGTSTSPTGVGTSGLPVRFRPPARGRPAHPAGLTERRASLVARGDARARWQGPTPPGRQGDDSVSTTRSPRPGPRLGGHVTRADVRHCARGLKAGSPRSPVSRVTDQGSGSVLSAVPDGPVQPIAAQTRRRELHSPRVFERRHPVRARLRGRHPARRSSTSTAVPTQAPKVDVRHPLRSGRALFASRWFAIGMAVALFAWLLHVAALAFAPLSVVQAVLSTGVVILAVLAERLFGFEVGAPPVARRRPDRGRPRAAGASRCPGTPARTRTTRWPG